MRLWIGCDSGSGAVVSIYGDRDGLISLLSDIALLAREPGEDLHLRTPSWGGRERELTEDRPGKGEILVHQLNVYRFDQVSLTPDDVSEDERRGTLRSGKPVRKWQRRMSSNQDLAGGGAESFCEGRKC